MKTRLLIVTAMHRLYHRYDAFNIWMIWCRALIRMGRITRCAKPEKRRHRGCYKNASLSEAWLEVVALFVKLVLISNDPT